MNKCDENKIDVFQSRCKIGWHERITNKEVLKMAEIEKLSEDVQRRRWKFIDHIMRQEPNNDCRTALTWAPRGGGGGAKTGKTKDNMEKDGGGRKRKSGMEELE